MAQLDHRDGGEPAREHSGNAPEDNVPLIRRSGRASCADEHASEATDFEQDDALHHCGKLRCSDEQSGRSIVDVHPGPRVGRRWKYLELPTDFAMELGSTAIVWACALFTLFFMKPMYRDRSFHTDDVSISYPMRTDTITDVEMAVLAIVGPMLCIIATDLTSSRSLTIRAPTMHAIVGLLMATALTEFACEFLKLVTSEPRPDLLDRCRPATTGAITLASCTTTNQRILFQGLKAFPSGHSAMPAAGMVYLMQWWLRRGGAAGMRLVRAVVPIYVTLAVAVTRVADNRHSWRDVFAGLVLGIGFGVLTFWWYHGAPDHGRGCCAHSAQCCRRNTVSTSADKPRA
ncbi:hypothetical protein AMAG_16772 [Allomyces macrogynus ATCC 38327]|uniref:Phosphatidic acid phosphatase type 2/haloperoxidase domain-containing protein n=1 Tax=Allomyces macrogynus (strain ATCC 38327) TaxID=578462 RepID=A0A0L0TBU5_ALLM3|nr:hypothetical protein AMAG_16772 [Allomyces macrogynus ATCC 38327]|eukprot:KNE72283.1 hypothetical protein AMAG_16772 [Allomyces macrogynus ATCC 38327]